jgi:hypothetical protein
VITDGFRKKLFARSPAAEAAPAHPQ